MLIIVCGLPGSGKSSLSNILTKEFSAVYLNSDVIRKQLFEKPAYTEEEKRKVYEEMGRRTEEMLKKENVIVDATFYRKEYRKLMINIAKKLGKKTAVIRCKIDEKEAERRLAKRKQGLSDADYAVYKKLENEFEPLEPPYLEIHSSKKKEVVKYIKRVMGEEQ
ncbi:AAA family ATPase [Candidatus Micrarchaeota archaeon]|nr:AAA family ATPase [Candidatus Micrarchaeota archaeon]